MLPEKAENLFLFIGDACLQTRIGHVITRTRVAINNILALVETTLKRHANRAFLGASPDKIFFFILEQIKQNPGDCFDYSGFASAVLARNRSRASRKFEC